MKKISGLIFCLILAFAVSLSALAADYNCGDMYITVPDFLVNDSEWAVKSDFDFAFSDADINMELNVSVYENDGYTYEGLDEENLNDHSQFLREKYETGDYSPLKDITSVAVTTEQGFAGIRSDLVFEDEHYVFYWFATEENCYDFNFYIYNEEYLSYAEQIIGTFSIGNKLVDAVTTEAVEEVTEAGETLPVLSDEEVEADGDGKVVDDDDRFYKIMLFPLPAILFITALIAFILLIIKRKKKESVQTAGPQNSTGNSGIYYDPNTGNYYKTVSADENVTPGQPVGYIYYPVQGNNNQQNNNSTQN